MMINRLLTFLALGLTACVSSDRMFDISPLNNELLDDKRINIWPLYYKNKDDTSLLWPLVDIDPQGFALRPFYVKDKNYWSVLYPWSEWETGKNEGWILPFYKAKRNMGLFPVFNVGDLSYIGPLWWEKDRFKNTVKNRGLFPVFSGGNFNHVGPIWWTSSSLNGNEGYGLFPLLWSFDKNRTFHFFPFYGENNYKNSIIQYSPLGLFYREKDYRDHLKEWVFPIYYRKKTNNSKTVFTLLGGGKWDKDGNTSILNILGPLYHRNQKNTFICWPLFKKAKMFFDFGPLFPLKTIVMKEVKSITILTTSFSSTEHVMILRVIFQSWAH